MAEPLKPIGFWSYTSSDDTRSGGRLSQLRRLLADELQLLIGRRQPVHVWQDVAAIPHGTDWLKEIHKALEVSSFFIPIVTPAFLESEMCCQEVIRFHQREQELGRDDLIFPFRYVDTTDFAPSEAHDPAVLALLQSRQWVDFVPLRHRPPDSEEVVIKLAGLAGSIRAALRRRAEPEPPPKVPEPTPQPPIIQAPSPPNPWIAKSVLGSLSMMREGQEPEMVLIPAGRFLMGAPEAESKRERVGDSNARPQHWVTISRPFWLGKYPVTRGEYAAFVAATRQDNESWALTRFSQGERHPVVNVSHDEALAYLEWLCEQTGYTYRLPSEAEWEYAARAGTTSARYWGEVAGQPGEHAHFDSPDGTRPVGLFRPNAFGLHDMLGNVREWTADNWHLDYTGAPTDGSAWTAGGAANFLYRGGSWRDHAQYVRAVCRKAMMYRNDDLGFRYVRAHE